MYNIKKIVKIGIVLMIMLCVFGAVFNCLSNSNGSDNRNPIKQEDMIKCLLDWGRLADLPDSKTSFVIKTEGNSFTRAFRSSFYLPKEALSRWVGASPGLQDADINSIGNKKKHYNIKPGENAAFAEAIIDYSTNYVEIYVYWS